MMLKRKYVVAGIILLLIGAVLVYNYIYQDHRDIQTEEAAFTGNAQDLKMKFQSGDQQLLNATVVVTGYITKLDADGVELSAAIHCDLPSITSNLELTKELTVKGRVLGYDDLFELVSLDQCTIITN